MDIGYSQVDAQTITPPNIIIITTDQQMVEAKSYFMGQE